MRKSDLYGCCRRGLESFPAVMQALKLLTPLIRKLGPNANPGKLKELPVKGGLMWAFFAGDRLLLACCHVSRLSDDLLHHSLDGTSFRGVQGY